MTKQEINKWFELREQKEVAFIDDSQEKELIRLNHLVMEASHDIHNNNMLNKETP